MKAVLVSISIAAALGTAALIAQQQQTTGFRTRMFGFHEVPSVFTPATGEFRATLNAQETELTYELEYSGLRAPVTQAHIHFGQPGVAAGIMIWLCGTETNPGPTGTPTCPQSGTVSGTLSAANVVGPTQQGIAAGDFAAVLRAMQTGFTYANVHSTQFPNGEIRGQIVNENEPRP